MSKKFSKDWNMFDERGFNYLKEMYARVKGATTAYFGRLLPTNRKTKRPSGKTR